MTAVAVVSLASWFGFFVGVAVDPDRTFRGLPATVAFVGMLVSSVVLAVNAL